jgi:hypothetical protein
MACQVRRGHGGMPLETPHFWYTSHDVYPAFLLANEPLLSVVFSLSTIGNTDDLHQAVLHIARRYPEAPIVLIGLSAGIRYVMLCYVTLRYVMLCYVTLRYVTLRYVTLRYVTLRTCRRVTRDAKKKNPVFDLCAVYMYCTTAGTSSVMRYAAELNHPKYKRGNTPARNVIAAVCIGTTSIT